MEAASSSSPVYFWGHNKDSSTAYLSQWYQCAFTDDKDPSIVFPTAEHYMMYHKALLFSDPATASAILAAAHPRDVKALGRKVANFSEPVWNQHRERIVRKGNLLKFTRPADDGEGGGWIVQVGSDSGGGTGGGADGGGEGTKNGISIAEMLLRTGEREIVEASPYDRIWGIGFTAAKAEAARRGKWGLNLLGKALMEVREELRTGREKGDGEGEKGEEGR